MDKTSAAFIRRSVRSYNGQNIPEEDLAVLCEAALSAPSARNTRPWELFVIRDKEALHTLSSFRPPWSCLAKASAAIVVAAKYDDYFEQNCGAATENILLTAAQNGIGSVWLGLWPHKAISAQIRTFLNAPEDVLPCCLIALGYPDKENAFHSIETEKEKIHWEKW